MGGRYLQRKTESLKKNQKALMYPIITLIIAYRYCDFAGKSGFPTFQEMFDNSIAELPAPTQFVVYPRRLKSTGRMPVVAAW